MLIRSLLRIARIKINKEHHVISASVPSCNLYHLLCFPQNLNQLKTPSLLTIWRIYLPSSIENPIQIKTLLKSHLQGIVCVFQQSQSEKKQHSFPLQFTDAVPTIFASMLLASLCLWGSVYWAKTRNATTINTHLSPAYFARTHDQIQHTMPTATWLPLITSKIIAVEHIEQNESSTRIAFYLHHTHNNTLKQWQDTHPEFNVTCKPESEWVSTCTLQEMKNTK
ncbi:MAG: hypothetical protein O3A01_06920 [bacterium]|nr:hypothetical protein [bacterium]